MQSKLTLRLDDSLIHHAKIYAKKHDKSLSKVVADYLKILTSDSKLPTPAPITQSLIGILGSTKIDDADYKKHLEDKYL